tara:strand:+ start:513 stop:779 length:267 start_codon:yes stop_codon:yes gene_type:complete
MLIFALVLAVLVALYVRQCNSTGKFTVYGTNWCGYTTKMRNYLNGKYGSGSHKFVYCDGGNCPADVDGFPVTVNNTTGAKIVGFNTTI